MEGLFLFLIAETAIATTISALQIKRRQQIVKRWFEGSLTEKELSILKHQLWFRRVWNPTKAYVSHHKKNN